MRINNTKVLYLLLKHFIYDYKLLKKEVDPNEKVEAKPDDDDQQPTKKQHRFNRFTPAQLQQLTSGITQQVSNVTHQVSHVTQQVTQHVADLALLRFMVSWSVYIITICTLACLKHFREIVSLLLC